MAKVNRQPANELVHLAEADQEMRNHALQTDEWDESTDERNTSRLKEIVATTGWPTISAVGENAASAAWLLVQHADHDPDFQTAYLKLIKQLPRDEVDQTNIAYLEDRVRVTSGRTQLYGTQFHSKGGTFGPRPIEDQGNLDKRRREAGLKPFAAYKAEIEAVEEQHRLSIASESNS